MMLMTIKKENDPEDLDNDNDHENVKKVLQSFKTVVEKTFQSLNEGNNDNQGNGNGSNNW